LTSSGIHDTSLRCLVQRIGIGIGLLLLLHQDVLPRTSELEVDVGFGRGSGGVEAFVPEARRLGVEVFAERGRGGDRRNY
jgi:hypothetical protein